MKVTGDYIEAPEMTRIVHFEKGDLQDIQAVVMNVVNRVDLKRQVEKFAKSLRASAGSDYDFLEKLWRFCKYSIRYRKDPPGVQVIKQPARLWRERQGDCKSLTVFIYHACASVGIPCIIRFASYNNKRKNIQHVYPVAILKDRQVAVDSVWDYFDSEENATRIEDWIPEVLKNTISGVSKPGRIDFLKIMGGIAALLIISK